MNILKPLNLSTASHYVTISTESKSSIHTADNYIISETEEQKLLLMRFHSQETITLNCLICFRGHRFIMLEHVFTRFIKLCIIISLHFTCPHIYLVINTVNSTVVET